MLTEKGFVSEKRALQQSEQPAKSVKDNSKLLEESKQRSMDVIADTQSLLTIVILALARIVSFSSRLFAVCHPPRVDHPRVRTLVNVPRVQEGGERAVRVCGWSSGRGVGVVWGVGVRELPVLRAECYVASETNTIKGNAYTLCVIQDIRAYELYMWLEMNPHSQLHQYSEVRFQASRLAR